MAQCLLLVLCYPRSRVRPNKESGSRKRDRKIRLSMLAGGDRRWMVVHFLLPAVQTKVTPTIEKGGGWGGGLRGGSSIDSIVGIDQGVTKRCRLSLLTNSALVLRVQMRGEWGSCGVSANEYSCAHHVIWSPNKLWRSTSINLWDRPLEFKGRNRRYSRGKSKPACCQKVNRS